MPQLEDGERRRVPALKVHQWLRSWDQVVFDPLRFRARPPSNFLLFAMRASELRALSGIFRRSTEGGKARSLDLGIQRRHDSDRSNEIREFVQHGFPWSSLGRTQRDSGELDDLKKPGWLPTAIVVNILRGDDTREGSSVAAPDLITIEDGDERSANLVLPRGFSGSSWDPSQLAPIEVIDGQHRLWAFQGEDFAPDFSLPVVAFHGLDISWQAYLFYTINIKPKRINTSLAFDLYPLLRTEDWLEHFEGHLVYRESRAQEITEALWSYPASPWYQRIDMLGNRSGTVTQAAWIRSLLATFVKSFESRRVRIGGLFGAPYKGHRMVLGWSRPQQAAFVIFVWQELKRAIADITDEWASTLRAYEPTSEDAAFDGKFSLLNSDQGVRGVLGIANDLCYDLALDLHLDEIDIGGIVTEGTSEGAIDEAIETFRKSEVGAFIVQLANALATYDWRTSGFPDLPESLRQSKARFRGGTGYRELRIDLIRHVALAEGRVSEVAQDVAELLGIESGS